MVSFAPVAGTRRKECAVVGMLLSTSPSVSRNLVGRLCLSACDAPAIAVPCACGGRATPGVSITSGHRGFRHERLSLSGTPPPRPCSSFVYSSSS